MTSSKKAVQGFGARTLEAHGDNGFGDRLSHQDRAFRRFESEAIEGRFFCPAKQLAQPRLPVQPARGAGTPATPANSAQPAAGDAAAPPAEQPAQSGERKVRTVGPQFYPVR